MIEYSNLSKSDIYYLRLMFVSKNTETTHNKKNSKEITNMGNKNIRLIKENNILDLQKPEKIVENILEGILILKRELTISELLSDINSALSSKNIEVDIALLNEMLRNINLSLKISLQTIHPDMICCEINNIDYNPKYHLDFEENVEIIPTLLGFLRINRRSSMRKISDNLSRSEGDILQFLSILAVNGVIDARIVDGICFIKAVHDMEISIPLHHHSRIIYGMLRNNKTTNIRDIMKLYNITRKEAEIMVFDFNSDTELDIEISRAGEIIVTKLPPIPLLTQLQHMPEINREILGILITNNTVSFDKIKEIWGLDSNQTKAVVYDLIGIGVILEIRLDKKELKLIKLNSLPLPRPYTELEDRELIEIIKYIEDNDEISIDQLSKELNVDKHQILKYIARIVGDGYFIEANLDADIFIKGSELKQLNVIYRCNCGNNANSIFCDDCGKQKLNCSVCNGKIEKSERILQCPNCDYPSHAEHIISWIKIKSICPICKYKIDEDNLIKGVIS